ncbi:hypothetical protein [Streptomyces showdoensis]|uniref:Lipoprotein n=1 Tax=Streptomyces showdoensis TaxID=68268 RepID=A0A2P2GD27_STREW|nr:hypothetical protein [Streptomyces showdoensis]KKZ69411.1 hypothetical protein VO63_34295 [Streptomyces showdoensis]
MSATVRLRRAALTATLCAAVAIGATACGPFSGGTNDDAKPAKPAGPFGDLSGPQIANKAIGATKAADSLTLDVALKTTDGPIKARLATDVRGHCAGTMTIGTTGSAELIKPDAKSVYMRFDEAFLKEQAKGESAEVQAEVVKQLKGRWLKTDANDPDAKDSLALCDLKSLLSEFEQGLNTAVKGKETTVGGKKALMLTQAFDSEKTTLYVATEGEPYLLKIVTAGGKEPGTVSFSDYDKPVDAKTPPAKDVVDEKDLG